MKRPSRSIKRETAGAYVGRRQLVIIVPPTADVMLIREKGRRIAFEVDALSIYHLGAKRAAAAKRKSKKKNQ